MFLVRHSSPRRRLTSFSESQRCLNHPQSASSSTRATPRACGALVPPPILQTLWRSLIVSASPQHLDSRASRAGHSRDQPSPVVPSRHLLRCSVHVRALPGHLPELGGLVSYRCRLQGHLHRFGNGARHSQGQPLPSLAPALEARADPGIHSFRSPSGFTSPSLSPSGSSTRESGRAGCTSWPVAHLDLSLQVCSVFRRHDAHRWPCRGWCVGRWTILALFKEAESPPLSVWRAKWVFLLGLAWIGAFSIGLSFVKSPNGLIVLRALQGVGAAMSIPAATNLVGRFRTALPCSL